MLAYVSAVVGCAGSRPATMREALNATAESVNTASTLVMHACDEAEEKIISEAESRAAAEEKLDKLRTRCDDMQAAFALVRESHEAFLEEEGLE